MADPERPVDSVSVWRGVLIAVVALNLGVIAWAVRLTVRLLRAPVELAAPAEGTGGAAGLRATGAAVRPGSGSTADAALTGTNHAGRFSRDTPVSAPGGETTRHLMEQDAVLRRELRENEGNDNGLTPSKEDVDRLMKDGRLIF